MPYRIIFTVSCIFLCNLLHAACLKPLSVGFAEWPPYQLMHNNLHSGFDVEFMAMLAKQLSCSVDYHDEPWDIQLANIRVGKLDLALGASNNLEREKDAYFTKPYRLEASKLFVRVRDLHKYKFNSVADLAKVNFLLGAELGAYYGPEFSALMNKPEFAQQVRMVIYTKINVQKLQKQMIDVFIADPQVADYYIKKFGYSEQIVSLPLLINQTEICIMVSKANNSSELLNQLNLAIGQSVKSEKYKLLESQYLKK